MGEIRFSCRVDCGYRKAGGVMIIVPHWDMKDFMFELTRDDSNPKAHRSARLAVLMQLMFRSNQRLRCWPSTKTLCKSTGFNQPAVVEARNWIVAHHAVVLVPYEKRMGDEKKLPVRQSVYQLTGVLKLANRVVPYLLMSPEMFQTVTAELENIGSDVSEVKTSVSEVSVSEPKGITIIKGIPKETVAPTGDKPARNEWYDAVFDIWKYTASLNAVMAQMLQGRAKQKGYQEYNLETPITPDQARKWAVWYRKTELKGDDNLSMLAKPMQVQSSVTRWQQLGMPDATAQVSVLEGLRIVS
jgi:hypothetical protein